MLCFVELTIVGPPFRLLRWALRQTAVAIPSPREPLLVAWAPPRAPQ